MPKDCIAMLQYLHLCQHLSQLELPALERTNIKLCQGGGGGGEVGPLCEKRIKTTELVNPIKLNSGANRRNSDYFGRNLQSTKVKMKLYDKCNNAEGWGGGGGGVAY